MKVQVYDSVSISGKALLHLIQCAVSELGGSCEIEEIQNADAIAEAGVEETPAWGIGDKIMAVGIVPSLGQIKADLITHCQQSNLS